MASVVVTLPAVKAPVDRKRVRLANRAGAVTLSSTSPETDLTSLGPEWTQIARPGLRPLLRIVGPQLKQVSLTALLYDQYHTNATIDPLINKLRQIAGSTDPVSVAYGLSDSGFFHITDLSVRVVRRAPGTNFSTRAEVSMTLQEALDDPRPGVAKTKTPPAPPAAVKTARVHVVKAGETLSGIAAAETGAAANWVKIAKDNGIKDPRKLKVGTRLKIL